MDDVMNAHNLIFEAAERAIRGSADDDDIEPALDWLHAQLEDDAAPPAHVVASVAVAHLSDVIGQLAQMTRQDPVAVLQERRDRLTLAALARDLEEEGDDEL